MSWRQPQRLAVCYLRLTWSAPLLQQQAEVVLHLRGAATAGLAIQPLRRRHVVAHVRT